jgi:tetratricopeptide (TPR) repeat protein
MGDRAAAVTTYHHCASVLERELGVVPDDATRAAFQRLITRPARGPAGAHGPPAATGTPAGSTAARTPAGATVAGTRPAGEPGGGRAGQPGAPLIGRSAEFSALHEIWLAAVAGRRGAALVVGGPGVGKTRLVGEVAELARQQGALVIATQCFAGPGRLALAPVADWLRDPAVQAATAGLAPAWRAEVARLVPDRSTAGGHDQGPGTMADAWQRHRFFEGLARALMAVVRPLLLVLDNVHWCDQETLDFITFFLGLAGDGTRLLVAGTVRDEHWRGDRDLAGWAVRMRAAGLLTELSLAPLGAPDTARLAQAISGRSLGRQDTATLHATTGGFPLYVIEATRGNVGEPLPPGDLSAVLRKRLAQTSQAAQEVAGLAAAVGTDFSLDLLTEASDLAPDGVVAAVDELWRVRILREFGTGYDFSHDLLRDAAYAEVTPARRWLLHRRVAQGLELLHTDDTDPVAARLAAQYARAGGQAKAVTYYRRAAQVAAGRFAHAEAVRLYREALSVVEAMPEGRDRDDRELSVRTALAAPLNATEGYASGALERDLQRSITLAEALGRDDLVQAGLVALATSWFVQGRTADSHEVATRALALARPGSGAEGQARFILGGAAFHMGHPAEGLRHLAVAVEQGDGLELLSVGTRASVHATAWGAHAHWLLGDDEAATRACDEALERARAIDDPYNLAIAFAYIALTEQMRGNPPALRDAVAQLRDLCERYEFAYYREWALILDGWSTGSNQDGRGTRLAKLGIGNLKAQGALARQPYWLSLLADLQGREGHPAAASATLDAALTAGRVHDDQWWLPEVMRMRAVYDPPERAVARLRAAADLASAQGSVALVRRCAEELRRLGAPAPNAAT